MKTLRSLKAVADAQLGAVVATIGNFDGVHLGHQAIMQRVKSRAEALGLRSCVISFSPHPLRILAPERAPRMLMTLPQKLETLDRMGLDVACILPFDKDVAAMPAEDFARSVLHRHLNVSELYIGPDFRFGRGRLGNVELLQQVGTEWGLIAEAIEPVLYGGQRISASRIRSVLSEGSAALAAELLGRPFALVGTIVHGDGRGTRQLVPTANLAPENDFIPARGVYVTRLRTADESFHALTNIGIRPTFGDHRLVVETHIPGVERDLYGERIELDFLDRIRDEQKFDSIDELKTQIERDLEQFESWIRTSA